LGEGPARTENGKFQYQVWHDASWPHIRITHRSGSAEPRFPDDYVHVANVEAESLGEAVRLTTDAGNTRSREAATWEKNEGVHALVTTPRETAAGDVVVDPHWKVHRFDGEGFVEIPLPKEEPPHSPGKPPAIDGSGTTGQAPEKAPAADREYWDEIVRVRDSADYLRHDGRQLFIRRTEGPRDPDDDYVIKFHDGRLTYGTSWWAIREIPSEYADGLPDNGQYITDDEYDRLAAMRGPEGQILFPVVTDPPRERVRSEIREIVHGDSGFISSATHYVPPDSGSGTRNPREWRGFPETAKLFVLERLVKWEGVGFTDKLELIEKHVDFSQVSPRDRQRALGRDWLARKAFDRLLVESAKRVQGREAAQRGGRTEPAVSGDRPENPGRGDARNKKRRGR
jgi:hypothetical protein